MELRFPHSDFNYWGVNLMKTIQYSDQLIKLFGLKEDETSAKTVTIQVTDACNLACTYCYQINKCTHSIPIDTGKKFIDDLLSGQYDCYGHYDKAQGIILEFIGGEPFMEIDTVSELTDYFIQRMLDLNHRWLHRYKISICSNGVLYFNPKVQNYIQKHCSHLSFSISIDGNKQLHDSCRVFPDGSGSYDIAIAAVEHYVKTYNIPMGSKMTIAPGNVNYVCDAVKGLIEKNYTEINLNCVYEEGWTAEHATILYNQLKQLADYLIDNDLEQKIDLSIFNHNFFHPKDPKEVQNWCGGNGAMLAVDWKGDLYPCIRYMESSLGNNIKPLIIGNVNTGILTTCEQKEIDQCLKCITRKSQSTEECFNCPIAEGCSWCSAYNYQCFGTVDKRATFICIMHKARCLANAYYWNKCFIKTGLKERFRLWIPKEWALEVIDENELQLLQFFEAFPHVPLGI